MEEYTAVYQSVESKDKMMQRPCPRQEILYKGYSYNSIHS
jgi:hypothetical protein